MIVITHNSKTITKELLEILKFIKCLRMDSYGSRNKNSITWRSLREVYLSVETLFLEMYSGMPADKALKKEYEECALPDSLLYSQRLFAPPEEDKRKPRKKVGRPRKYI